MGWADIRKAINSNLSKPLNELIGASNPETGGTDTVINYLKYLDERGTVKSVQSGIATAIKPGSGKTDPKDVVVTISPVDIEKCMILIDGSATRHLDGYEMFQAYKKDFSKNSITFSPCYARYNGTASNSYAVFPFSWQVIEFY